MNHLEQLMPSWVILFFLISYIIFGTFILIKSKDWKWYGAIFARSYLAIYYFILTFLPPDTVETHLRHMVYRIGIFGLTFTDFLIVLAIVRKYYLWTKNSSLH